MRPDRLERRRRRHRIGGKEVHKPAAEERRCPSRKRRRGRAGIRTDRAWADGPRSRVWPRSPLTTIVIGDGIADSRLAEPHVAMIVIRLLEVVGGRGRYQRLKEGKGARAASCILLVASACPKPCPPLQPAACLAHARPLPPLCLAPHHHTVVTECAPHLASNAQQPVDETSRTVC